jgi:excisionase family DNA binding protein
MTNLSETIFDLPPREQGIEAIWNSDQAARYLRISPRTLTRMARRGEIPSIQIGRLWRFRRCDLDEWLTHKVNLVSYPCRLNS